MKNRDLIARQEAAKRLTKAVSSIFPALRFQDDFLEGVQNIVRHINQIKQNFGPPLTSLHGILRTVHEERERGKRIEAAGWLPHYTTPFNLIDPEGRADEIDELVSSHYRDNFPAVKREFLTRVDTYDLDDELKATFREALDCHGNKAYRATVRLLFPEIERVACQEVYGGSRSYTPEQGRKTKITSLPDFFDKAMSMPAGEILSFDYGWELLRKFGAHLYVPVDPPDLPSITADPVPNRHASLHGMVVYSTAKNSMNTLIMADFVFHIISAMKPYLVLEPEP
ncbi:hypothetical protein HFO61_30245 [Rhizobium leguminosarum]|uniref:hypothetical protein n=1 Tax=Rhizobium leguminosarum TaxID=384 RepID=UPI001C954176|nr:hypothetical protein [Rhizobium leguminosarum]MBY5551028.1 hypothetical protein [Rhizobium leguminosarum]